MERVLTTCGYCGCGCNYFFNVEEGEIVGIAPQSSHPVSQGKLCIKGWQGYSFVYNQDRLKMPLKKGNEGEWGQVRWTPVLDEIHQKLSNIVETYGPEAVGILASARCTNEENYMLTKFARAILRTPNIDHCARL